jgi:hypothetical protein
MITIFGDFPQFSEKKLAFFLKTNVMINLFLNLALFWVKNANFFAKIFGENIFKNHNIGPRQKVLHCTCQSHFSNGRILGRQKAVPGGEVAMHEMDLTKSHSSILWVPCRVARFFLVRYSNRGKNLPIYHKLGIPNGHKINPLAVKWTKCSLNIPTT